MWYLVPESTIPAGRIGLPDFGSECVDGDLVGVLGGNDDGVDAGGFAVDVFDADLALAVRTEKVQLAGAAHVAQLPHQLVGHHDGERHQLGSFVACVAEHHALVARAARVHPHGNVRRLRLDDVQHAAGLVVEAEGGVRVAHVLDGFPRQARYVDVALGGDFARHHADSGGDQSLAGHSAVGILLQHRIENRIGYLVGDLVGVPLGDGLGREYMPLFL
jgi:hypothetical protein